MAAGELERLVQLLAKLPGLGPRSARRGVLQLIRKRDTLMLPLADAMSAAAAAIRVCGSCGNYDTCDPCALCCDERRDRSVICVVAEVADLWALERAQAFRGLYHVLGGTLSALDGVGPEDLGIERLALRVAPGDVVEVILALSATMDGQITAHYIADRLARPNLRITRLAHGVPVGGELDYLDDGTLTAALRSRRETSGTDLT